jgi:hypothetical protein
MLSWITFSLLCSVLSLPGSAFFVMKRNDGAPRLAAQTEAA